MKQRDSRLTRLPRQTRYYCLKIRKDRPKSFKIRCKFDVTSEDQKCVNFHFEIASMPIHAACTTSWLLKEIIRRANYTRFIATPFGRSHLRFLDLRSESASSFARKSRDSYNRVKCRVSSNFAFTTAFRRYFAAWTEFSENCTRSSLRPARNLCERMCISHVRVGGSLAIILITLELSISVYVDRRNCGICKFHLNLKIRNRKRCDTRACRG